jgi:hypothetical protein
MGISKNIGNCEDDGPYKYMNDPLRSFIDKKIFNHDGFLKKIGSMAAMSFVMKNATPLLSVFLPGLNNWKAETDINSSKIPNIVVNWAGYFCRRFYAIR